MHVFLSGFDTDATRLFFLFFLARYAVLDYHTKIPQLLAGFAELKFFT